MRDNTLKKLYEAYRRGIQAKMNIYLNILLWFISLTGPALALGVRFDIFPDITYSSCIIIFIALLLIAGVHLFLVKKTNFISLAKYVGLIGVELMIIFLVAAHGRVTITHFIVPLLCLFFCDRMTYVISSAIAYVGGIICLCCTYSQGTGSMLGFAEVGEYWDYFAGFNIQFLLMLVVGLILITQIQRIVEDACTVRAEAETDKVAKLIQRASHTAYSKDNPNDGIMYFISEIGGALNCDRVTILELNERESSYDVSTYWAKPDSYIPSKLDKEDNAELIHYIEELLETDIIVKIDNTEKLKDTNPLMYRIFRSRKISSLMAVPFEKNSRICGYLFVINYSTINNNGDLTNVLMLTGDIVHSLVNLKNAFIKTADDAMIESLGAIANIFHTMCKIDLVNDRGLLIKAYGRTNDEVVYVASEFYSNGIYDFVSEIDRDNMRKFLDFSTLNERMKGKNSIAIDYQDEQSKYCRACFVRSEVDENGDLTEVILAVESTDEEKRRENRLIYLSETDMMTGIRNRGSGEQKIEELIKNKVPGCFILMDADRFKSINDTYGHGVGDEVIIALAQAMNKASKKEDVVMRLGGDEFAAYLVGVTTKEDLTVRRDELFDIINSIHIEALGERKIEVSVGAAINLPGQYQNFDELYKRSDTAMYFSKKQPGNYAKVFIDGMI